MKPKDKKLKPSTNDNGISKQYPVFSYSLLTVNNSHNFNFFGISQKNDKHCTAMFLHDKLEYISRNKWSELGTLRKESGGFETIPFKEITFKPNYSIIPNIKISTDTKVIVFRYNTWLGSDQGRIIGIKLNEIFYIIGFDFDFSGYEH